MRSAPCALAPSHPFHVMPSRITRNSHRPRASDRTMVALKHHLACRCLKLDGRVTISRETHEDEHQAKLLQRTSGDLRETFIEDFRKEFNEIQSPVARRLYVLAKLIRLTHMRIGEYVALTAAADLAGHHGVAVLLETCLADKLAFVDRNRRLIRRIAEARVAERLAA